MRLEGPQGLQDSGSEMTPEQVRQEIERYKVRPGSGSGPRGMGGGSGRIQGSATTSPKPPPASLGWSCPPKTTPGPGDCWVLRFFGGDFSPPSPCKLPASSHQQISGVGFSKECDLSKCSVRGRSGGEGVFRWMRTGLRGCAWGWMRSGVGRVPISDGSLWHRSFVVLWSKTTPRYKRKKKRQSKGYNR